MGARPRENGWQDGRARCSKTEGPAPAAAGMLSVTSSTQHPAPGTWLAAISTRAVSKSWGVKQSTQDEWAPSTHRQASNGQTASTAPHSDGQQKPWQRSATGQQPATQPRSQAGDSEQSSRLLWRRRMQQAVQQAASARIGGFRAASGPNGSTGGGRGGVIEWGEGVRWGLWGNGLMGACASFCRRALDPLWALLRPARPHLSLETSRSPAPPSLSSPARSSHSSHPHLLPQCPLASTHCRWPPPSASGLTSPSSRPLARRLLGLPPSPRRAPQPPTTSRGNHGLLQQ